MSFQLGAHPKVLQMAKSLRVNKEFLCHAFVTGHECDISVTGINEIVFKSCVIGGLLQVWGVARKHGVIDGLDITVNPLSIADLDSVSGFPGFGEAMELVGWAVQEDNQLIRFPNCLENITSPEEIKREKARLRKQRQRANENEENDCDMSRTMSRGCHADVTPREDKIREDIYIKEKEKNKAKKENEKLDTEIPNPDETPANGLVVEKTERKERIPTVLVEQIFEDWKHYAGNPGARLGKKRPEIIRGAVRMGYDRDQLRQAFIGCARSYFHNGFNEQGKKYNDLELILRSEKNIDRFIGYASNPPKPTFKTEDNTPLLVRRQAQEFWEAACADARGQEAPGRGSVIDADAWETIQPKLAH